MAIKFSKRFGETPAKICANKIELSKEYLPSMKTLGLISTEKEDQFTYHNLPIEAHFQ